ncbi:ATP-binding protein [Pseudodesulfovibrio sp. zrk46]|uniref:ATP-binding protein n=1 Tax=Pseudodesulfovibrio sp. zrk46 TaxID=2725288 RepID=UPI0014498E8D|nr:ATP-binding protein [Pseudodesulfovibrio sp. zrk46]QJB57187.1 GHKL domain-containing protein [Pseudodesulfovibrio sp. zrk46]
MLADFIKSNEQWLMERVLSYATQQEYTKYTSTLVEAWRVSIVGMSDAIVQVIDKQGEELLEFGPNDRFSKIEFAAFGIKEAQLHRKRGISLQMFLGLYKYYRYSFIDLIRTMNISSEKMDHYEKFVERVFDLIEIAFCSEWAGLEADNAILELQKNNREMTNEKNKYLTLFESLDVPVFLINNEGNIDNLNPSAATLIGEKIKEGGVYYGIGEILDRIKLQPLSSFFPWLDDVLRSFFENELQSEQFETVLKEGEHYIHKLVRLARMCDVSGKFRGGIVVIEDTTDKKRVEQQLAQSQKLEGIGVLASGIAHEINTPIHFIGNNLKYLHTVLEELKDSIDIPQSHMKDMTAAIRESQEGVERVANIVKALKRFAHPNTKDLVQVRIDEVVDNIVEITRNEWKYIAEVTTGYQDDRLCIEGIPGEIGQIVLNLIMNSVQAIKERERKELGSIEIHVTRDGNFIVITVSDDGCGISLENRHRVFDPFFTTKEVGQGTGQGLHIAHSLVRKHKGSIDFSSHVGRGTSFKVKLPACREQL